MKTLITKHATKRLKQRLGLGRKAHQRHIKKVLVNGVVQYRDIEKRILYVWYDYRKYIFEDYKGLKAILITVFPRDKTKKLTNNQNFLTPLSIMSLNQYHTT